jgi:plasminogen activator inhibitor 1 RNA-binding protein
MFDREKKAQKEHGLTFGIIVSPPSRRARGDQESFETLHKEEHKPDDRERKGRDANRRHGVEPVTRGRQFDRRSGEVGEL